MYHCHVEATEHMQMGMLGNLYVQAAQNGLPDGTNLERLHRTRRATSTSTTTAMARPTTTWSTRSSSAASTPTSTTRTWNVQPLPFALMRDSYPMINGRGYPDTVNRASTAGARRERRYPVAAGDRR